MASIKEKGEKKKQLIATIPEQFKTWLIPSEIDLF